MFVKSSRKRFVASTVSRNRENYSNCESLFSNQIPHFISLFKERKKERKLLNKEEEQEGEEEHNMGGGGEIALHGQSSKLSSFLSLKDVSTKTINTPTTVQNLTEKMKTKKKNINNTTEKEEEEEEEGKQQQKQQQQQQHRRMRLDGLQNYGTEYCWALDKSGTPCEKKAQKKCPVPYCSKHLRVGDDAFSTREHPLGIGKILIANFDLPKNYKMVYFGTRKPVRKLNKLRKDYMLSFWQGGGVIDPQDCPVSSKLQYMSNPGPAERSNVTCTDRMFGDTRDEGIVGREYKTTEFIPKGTQMLQFYGPQWFASRDMEKINVGTNKYPAPLKRKRV